MTYKLGFPFRDFWTCKVPGLFHGKAEDGKSSLATTAVNEWSIVESKLEQFKSDERIRLLTALKSYNDSLTERANLLEKNQKMSRHNDELKMLLNINRQD
mgnify:CR=1 FL=1